MTGPEIMASFEAWASRACAGWAGGPSDWQHVDCYPLYIGHSITGTWYVRERLPGTRVWRAEEDGSFVLLPYERAPIFAGE